MTDRPILFSEGMVQALLADAKLQTRRLASSPLAKSKVGDRLWVRETWSRPNDAVFIYRANWREDALARGLDNIPADDRAIRWRPNIHMPRVANRLVMTLSANRIERLQAISWEEAKAEGIIGSGLIWAPVHAWRDPKDILKGADPALMGRTPIEAYRKLWSSLHQTPGERWEDNPEVVALSWPQIHRVNIDQLATGDAHG